MAKNLKLNVKNAQLAEALKLGAIKKPSVKKKKAATASEDVLDTQAAAPKMETPQVNTPVPPPTPSAQPVNPAPAAPRIDNQQTEPARIPLAEPSPSAQARHEESDISPPRHSANTERTNEASTPPSSNYARSDSSEPRYASRPPSRGHYSEERSNGGGPYRSNDYPRSPSQGYSSQSRPSSGYSSSQGNGYPPRHSTGYSSPSGGRPTGQGGYQPRPQGNNNYGSPRPGYGSGASGGYRPAGTGGYGSGAGGGYRPAGPGGYGSGAGGGYRPAGPGGYRPGGAPPFQRRPDGAPGSRPPYSPRPRPLHPGAGGGFTGQPGGYRPEGRRPPLPGRAPILPEESKGERKGRGFEEEPRKVPHKDFKEHKPGAKKQTSERSFDARDRYGLRDGLDEQGWRKKRPMHKARSIQHEEVIRPKNLHVRLPITIKDLAQEMKLKASQLITKLFMKGVTLTLNDFLDDETTVQLLGHDFDCEIQIDRKEENRLKITDKTIKQEIQASSAEELTLRPPVVTFMGHVDHGKTSLIDTIRKSDIAGDEAGAITQHIGAFKCHTAVGDITILDTPGHEAFSAMRSRGADVTDIVVLVVAGDEGIRTQTIEAIEQAQTAGVPILVALNKCDKPNFNADNVYRQLSEHNLLPEPWGGQTIVVNCSATTGEGVKELLEMLALQAEVLELRANPHSRARGSVIESEMHKGMGAVATILVQNGTLRLGDSLVFSQQFARIKTMHNEHDKEITEAGPSTPVKITGLSALPEAGSEFIVVKNEKEAMEIAEKRSEGQRHALLHQTKRGLESVLAEKATGIKKKTLNLILRADVQGSVEALKTSLLKISSTKIDLNIISAAVGEVSESDVQLASASKAVIVGFHTQIESHAESLIKAMKVNVKLHDIIYHAVDDIRELMRSLLDKVAQESDTGSAEVKAVFKASQLGMIAGCSVLDGSIKRSAHVRLVRNNEVVWKGPIQSLKRVKEDVREVSKGYECGIVLHNQNDVKVGDILQAFEITYLEQDL